MRRAFSGSLGTRREEIGNLVPHPASFDRLMQDRRWLWCRSSGWGTDGTPYVSRLSTRSAADPRSGRHPLRGFWSRERRPPRVPLRSTRGYIPSPAARVRCRRIVVRQSVAYAKRSRPTKWASPSSRVLVSRAPATPGSASLHPGLHSITRCAGSLPSDCRASIGRLREARQTHEVGVTRCAGVLTSDCRVSIGRPREAQQTHEVGVKRSKPDEAGDARAYLDFVEARPWHPMPLSPPAWHGPRLGATMRHVR
jgi:hypothetical protein